MNCEKCQELLSDFIDGTLTGEDRILFDGHLVDCLSCVGVREEMRSIVGVARQTREHFAAPPNERAMWLRIRNTVETELDANRSAKTAVNSARDSSTESFWSRWMGKRWELSLPQLATSVAAIAATVALVTTLGIRSIIDDRPVAGGQRPTGQTTNPQRGVIVDGNFPGNGVVRQVDIDYWQQRVAQRKASWNPRMRDAFDRSIGVINEAVNESVSDLNRNPHDEVSEEMLNAALRDKMELLKEFSEF
ncbi:MAG TPA: zf-HC2 domain-containing protein [Pyrinomonadaceae bacterium]|jgi:hypothetical protein|nr:zf-HC2 domain-containing protein [Pyrinomonadaceae bacterium]